MSKFIRTYGNSSMRLMFIGPLMVTIKNTRRQHLYWAEYNGFAPRAVTLFGWRISVMSTAKVNPQAVGIVAGLAVIIALQCVVMPTLDARAAARDKKRQQAALVEQNKRLFQKLTVDSEYMTFPVSAYKDEAK